MQASVQQPRWLDSSALRWTARASAIVLAVTWLAYVLAEAAANRFAPPSLQTHYQGIAFAILFIGYAVGWRKELAGGLLAILGVLAFFAVHVATLGTLPGLAIAWFALPGVLYLLAWYAEHSGYTPTRQA